MRLYIRNFLALILMCLPVAACSDENRAVIHLADGTSHKFSIELVDTQELRSKGLMFRQDLGADAGMLFDFLEEREVAFWMQNTFIPLDMLFIAADGTIRNIHVNARPQDPTSIPSDGPVRFVLEIPGGRSVELGIAAGDRLEYVRVAE